MIWWLSTLAMASPPELWVEGDVGAWRSTSCGCVDNVASAVGAGLSLPMGEQLALELRPRLHSTGRMNGTGVLARDVSLGLRALTRDEVPSLALGAGLRRSWLRYGLAQGHLGVWARAGVHLEPGGWVVEPAVELSGMQGALPHSTASLSVRVGRVLAPTPAAR